MGPGAVGLPPLPPGAVLDVPGNGLPPLPPGAVLDAAPLRSPDPARANAAANPAAPVESDPVLDAITGVGDAGLGLVDAGLSGIVAEGVPALLGAPVDIMNALPMLGNILPGEQGIGPMSDNPPGGSQTFHDLFQLPNDAINAATGSDLTIDYEPRNILERGMKRVGEEVGASLPPVLGAINKAQRVGRQGLETMGPIQRHFVEPAVVNPRGLVKREAAAAGAAGAGAQASNEFFGPEGGEGTLTTDLAGSLGGASLWSLGKAAGKAGSNLVAGATNSPEWLDDVVGSSVTDKIIDNSQHMHDQAEPFMLRGQRPKLDTTSLARTLREPLAIEEMVPGFEADIGQRAKDPRLQTFVQDVNSRSAGSGNARTTRNNTAVNARVEEMEPQGDPGRFRADLQTGVDQKLYGLEAEEDLARKAFEDAEWGVSPQMANETARGSDIRAALQQAYDMTDEEVSALYEAIDASDTQIDPRALAERFGAVDESLPMNDRLRFRPAEADVPGQLLPEGEGPAAVPIREATSIRSGLSNDIQGARAAGQPRQASIAKKYRSEVDDYLENLDPETAQAYGDANRARFDMGQRFEEGNTAIAQSLRQTERGGYQMDASALPRKFLQPDTGKISDYQGLMREAGTDQRVRDAIEDQMKADIKPHLNNPERLKTYMAGHKIVLDDFPDLRARIEDAGGKRATLTDAERERATTEKDLTTRGRSPEARYLTQESDRDAARELVRSPSRVADAKRLIATADTPEARGDLRAAFWEEIRGRGQNRDTDLGGQDVWNAGKVRDTLKNPKFDAVAKELWRDDPEDLQAIRDVFDALEAAAPGKARAPGSSGTAQSLAGKLDPSLTVTSIASRARSVNRGQLSLGIALVDLGSTWMRNRSARVQGSAIDTMAAQVVNNPGLAADLLERFNPADYAARRRMLTQKYGPFRINQLLTILDEANDEENDPDAELKGAVNGD